MYLRKKTKEIKIGNVFIGGNHPIAVQSMANVPLTDKERVINQIKRLKENKCEIVRVAVPDMESVKTISLIKEQIEIPLVADIHFDYKLAIESVYAGIDKIRINPGNIGDELNVKKVVDACKERNIPIRIGVNSGSLEKEVLKKYDGKVTAAGIVDSAFYHIKLLEKYDFNNIVVSLKSSNVQQMIESYRLISEKCDYPLHLGVTEAGTNRMGTIKSAIGIGSLLCDGIGDTIRVSLTDDVVNEVLAGYDILRGCNVRNEGINIVSCPTCGRTKVNIIEIAEKAEKALEGINKNLTVAIMGCAVNGPGEAREADIGIAGGNGEGLLFKKGEIIRKVPESDILSVLIEEIEKM